jgi:hypothetical protein
MSASGCCGRLEGDFLMQGGERCFPERRSAMEAMGPLYRDLRSRYGSAVEITVVDPRNLISVVPLLIRDAHAHGIGLLEALRTLFRIKMNTVVVNGRLLTRGRWPDSAKVHAALGDPLLGWEEAAGELA